MESLCFHDGNITNLINKRYLDVRHDSVHELQMHSSLVKRMALERELEMPHFDAVFWTAKGGWLMGDLTAKAMNIWSYSGHKLLHSIETGHSANIFCTKFIPETSDELVVSGAGDAEVRLFHLSHQKGRGEDNTVTPAALFQCHTRRVKKLAVEVGNPHVVWSASEDGTVRQHDLREGASCPPAGSSRQECRNILLDLRCGAKKSLADPPKQLFALKSCDISSTRPHLLIVGGSDAFARLYDRRMLPPLSSSQKKLPPPPCVSYFCPMHLSDRGRSNLHMTHVAFSPNGEEVLLSYSGEHVYLMDVNPAHGNSISYTSGDVSNLMNFAPSVNGIELQSSVSGIFLNGSSSKRIPASKLEKCKRLIQMALNSLKEDSNFYYGIEACNEVLDGCRDEIGPLLSFECLCTRAAILLKRKWKNDAHMAIRDCHRARKLNSSSFRPLILIADALSQLGKHKEALEFAIGAQSLATSNSEVALKVESIKEQIAAAEADKTNRANGGESRSDPRAGRVLSLSDILYRSDANSDASQDGHRSERDDSDDDEELELAFETSMSGDEGQDVDPNVLHGSLNLRIHRRGDSTGETGQANGSCGSPASCQKEKTAYQPETVIDMKQRYVGHCNVGTDIKQASFLGERGEYIASGSDDGRWFIWEKRTGRLIKMLHGDEAVVNCVQCHPYDCVVATSGIDNTIKIWTPTASVPSLVAGGAAGPETSNVLDAMESNQRRLCRTREAVLPFEFLERFRMHEFTEGSLHPFECTQS
ncbi:hypothetical protein EJD97_017119 [Solanum chilense]|uniref:Uncharacterized protein n=1 Tax=Solanum chilense TaxID=4083 RepID=A0A6N2B3R9_SOLCI|nr:hypothetical protein EJD97_017119 [Solanum chilense]